MTKPTEATPPKRVEVKLAKPHTHRGEKLKPDAEIKVTEKQQNRLKERGIIQ